jgi:integrase
MRWRDLDLRQGVWTKLSSHTKQKQDRVPISAPARQLLADIRAQNNSDEDFVFPGVGTDAPQTTLKKAWESIRRRATMILYAADPESPAGSLIPQLHKALGREPSLAEIDSAAAAAQIKLPAGLRDLRLHDLRHSYASFLVSEGLSLSTIGALLGHTQPATTHRYSHLHDDPLRKATERIGEIISGTGKPDGETISFDRQR